MKTEIEKGDAIITDAGYRYTEITGKTERIFHVLSMEEVGPSYDKYFHLAGEGFFTPFPNVDYPDRYRISDGYMSLFGSEQEPVKVIEIKKGEDLASLNDYEKYLEFLAEMRKFEDTYLKGHIEAIRKDYEAEPDMAKHLISYLNQSERKGLENLLKVDKKAENKEDLIKIIVRAYYLKRRGMCSEVDDFKLLDELSLDDKVTRYKMLGSLIIEKSVDLLEKTI